MPAIDHMRRLRPPRSPRPRRLSALGRCGLLCSFWVTTAAAAPEFWHAKPPDTWSEKEIEQLLSNSPWARTVEIIVPDMSLAGRVGGLQGGRVGGFGGQGRPGAGGGAGGHGAGNLGGGTFLPSPTRARITVRWASAGPIQAAMARRRGDRALTSESPTQTAGTHQDDRGYRIAVARVPLMVALGEGEELHAAAALTCRDGRVLHPTAVHFALEDDLQTIEYTFPSDTPLTVETREVEFKTRVGDAPVKAKFRIDRMVVDGRPAL
jgi:hypothetical protein